MDKKQKTKKKGFTLIELMIVIVIIGILAAVAIPKFTAAQYKATVSEFPTVLTQIYTAEGAYEAENLEYIACPTDRADAAWTTLGVVIPAAADPNFNYSVTGVVTAAAGNEFVANAVAAKNIGQIVAGDAATVNQIGGKTAAASILVYAPNWQ